MKSIVKTLLAAALTTLWLGGCVAGSSVSHADDPAATSPVQGPELCRDGTAPPCVRRD